MHDHRNLSNLKFNIFFYYLIHKNTIKYLYSTSQKEEIIMKYVVVIGDGMADYPIKELNGETPLQKAEIPNMDHIASMGISGMLKTVPENMTPGSDVANLSIMGYDPKIYYTGRGPIEAASIGAKMDDGDVAFRCNLITEDSGILSDFNAGHISTFEASEIIETLNQKFYQKGKFYLGTSYRHLFVIKDKNSAYLKSTPPHDVVGESIEDNLLKPKNDKNAEMLNQMMYESKELLKNHPVNEKRVSEGKLPSNMIWLWGQGIKPSIPAFKDKYGINGATITGVDLVKGLGMYMGLSNIHVPGATGYYDTDYCGKAKNALKALETHDLVFVHIEAPDEAGHAGNLQEKIKAIERIDKRILGKILNEIPSFNEYSVAVLPDHPTPLILKTHTSDPVPCTICSTNGSSDDIIKYDEYSASKGSMGILMGYDFIKKFMNYALH
jgi:2,3-bisphosphoglycerate-independent phosphoglycerate mutase